jgi:N-acetyl sugar amidotransferase
MKSCAKGVWNETIPGITFDDEGVSNYCRLQEAMMSQYPRGSSGQEEWKGIISQIKAKRGSGTYDCIVGVSGGVDSSYLLVLLKEAGLNPLAVNLDNGFNSEIAVQNIYKVTSALNIDLETHVINYEEIKELLKAYMRANLPWIDAPTDLAIKAVMYKIALKENVKFIIRGNDFRSEGKQPIEWTYADAKQLKYVYRKYSSGIKLKTYPMLSYVTTLYAAYFKGIKDIRPFYYINYTKQDAKVLLQSEYGWRDYGGHHHENLFTKFAIAYWLPQKCGIDKRMINLSAQVLANSISRDEAIDQLKAPFETNEELEKLKNYIIKKLEFSDEEFMNVWNSPNRSFVDYPSNYQLIYGLLDRFSKIISKVYAYQPMSVTARKFISS